MNIVVVGSSATSGMAVIRAALLRGHRVVAVGRAPLADKPAAVKEHIVDLYDHEALTSVILEYFPDAVVNTAAMSDPVAIAADTISAEIINVALPRRLAQICHHVSARCIHLSCMGVFDGGAGPYRSTDMPSPPDLSGQIKLMAEREVLRFGGNAVVCLRLPLLLGNSPSGERSFHERLLRRIAADQPVEADSSSIVQPCATDNLGEVVVELCERPNLHGIFHWAGSTPVSEYDLTRQILDHFGLAETDVVDTAAQQGRDLSSDLRPLVGKLRTEPASLEAQIRELQLPPDLDDWHAAHAGGSLRPRRLRRGVDFQ